MSLILCPDNGKVFSGPLLPVLVALTFSFYHLVALTFSFYHRFTPRRPCFPFEENVIPYFVFT